MGEIVSVVYRIVVYWPKNRSPTRT